MRITEIKSQNVKILYKPSEDKIAVGDFVDFYEGATGLVAQVYKITSNGGNSGEYNQAELVFLITVKYGKAFPWNGEVVSAEAKVKKTSSEFIENYINKDDFEDVFALGYCTGTYNMPLRLSFKNFRTPAFVGYEKQPDNAAFLKAVAHQLRFCGRKLLIIDYKGNIDIDSARRVVAGYEMKLPLNSETLENLSSKMTLGVSADAKAVIEEVLIDLAGFARETGDFISISKLIRVIDETYKKSKISQLILFKNKLRIYQKLNIFADAISETTFVDNALTENSTVIFDISNIPSDWQNEFLNKVIYSSDNAFKDYYLYLPIERDVDSKLLNYLLFKAVKNGIKPILAANYRYVAMDSILDFSANSFLFSTTNALAKREYLSCILQSLPQDYFVVMGELTSSLPVVSYLGEPIEIFDTNSIKEQNRESNEALDIIQDSIDVNSFVETQKEETPITNVDMNAINTAIESSQITAVEQKIETPQEEAEEPAEEVVAEPIAEVVEEPPVEVIPEPVAEVVEQPVAEVIEEPTEEIVEEPVAEVIEQPAEEVVEEPPVEVVPEPVAEIVEEPVEEIAEEPPVEILEEQEEEIQLLPVENVPDNQVVELQADEDELFDDDEKLVHKDILDTDYKIGANAVSEGAEEIELDDLDFLDDVQTDDQSYTQNDEDELLDLLSETDDVQGVDDINVDELDFDDINTQPQAAQIEQQEAPPQQKLPVYEAEYREEKPSANTITLQEGDLVKHNKYGLGTVKKLINHGNKIMCFINFEDFGRRLLDPEISQLEKIQ